MGAKSSTPSGHQSPRSRTFSSSSTGAADPTNSAHEFSWASGHNATADGQTGFNILRNFPGLQVTQAHGHGSSADRQRARSLSSVPDIHQSGGGGGGAATGVPPYIHPAVSATAPGSNNFGSAMNNGANGPTQQQQRHHHLAMMLNGSPTALARAGNNPHGHVFNIEDLSQITLANTEYNGIALAAASSTSATSTSSGAAAGGLNDIGRVYTATSLPSHIWSFNGIKCPVCNKFILPDDIEYHLVMCLTKPRLSYNEDVLADAKGECVICLEDLNPGDIIARLPCLCIYHKGCIDRWFEVNRSCPEHPGD